VFLFNLSKIFGHLVCQFSYLIYFQLFVLSLTSAKFSSISTHNCLYCISTHHCFITDKES